MNNKPDPRCDGCDSNGGLRCCYCEVVQLDAVEVADNAHELIVDDDPNDMDEYNDEQQQNEQMRRGG